MFEPVHRMRASSTKSMRKLSESRRALIGDSGALGDGTPPSRFYCGCLHKGPTPRRGPFAEFADLFTLADCQYDRARPGMPRIGRVTGILLDDHDVRSIAVDGVTRLGGQACDDHRHERRQWSCGWWSRVARIGDPVCAAGGCLGRLCKAFEASGRRSPAKAVLLGPLGTPKLNGCTDRRVQVTDHETAPARTGGESNGTARRAAESPAACQGHGPFCQESASKACAGRGDVDA